MKLSYIDAEMLVLQYSCVIVHLIVNIYVRKMQVIM